MCIKCYEQFIWLCTEGFIQRCICVFVTLHEVGMYVDTLTCFLAKLKRFSDILSQVNGDLLHALLLFAILVCSKCYDNFF